MELWVRSQDRRILQKVDNIFLDANYDNKRICSYDNDSEIELGTYETEKRALEVLDEIQKQFDFKIENKCYEEADLLLKANMFPKIYQMPEE